MMYKSVLNIADKLNVDFLSAVLQYDTMIQTALCLIG